MKKSCAPVVALISLLAAGCASYDREPGLSQQGRSAGGGIKSYYEEIRAPAAMDLMGVECLVR